MKIKLERVNADLSRKIAEIIAKDIKDPRMEGCIVGVTKTTVTPDLKYAKVWLSIYAPDEIRRREALDTVSRSKSFIRNRLKDAVQIRTLPELIFLIDDSADYGMKIEGILSKIEIPPEEPEDGSF